MGDSCDCCGGGVGDGGSSGVVSPDGSDVSSSRSGRYGHGVRGSGNGSGDRRVVRVVSQCGFEMNVINLPVGGFGVRQRQSCSARVFIPGNSSLVEHEDSGGRGGVDDGGRGGVDDGGRGGVDGGGGGSKNIDVQSI